MDTGVSPSEGLAFIYTYESRPDLFLPTQPQGTTGLARRLNADAVFYVACRWDYESTSKEMLADKRYRARVTNPQTGESILAWPADWGPHVDTQRTCDLSPAVMDELGLDTDDVVDVEYPYEEERQMRIVISSGHGRHVQGADGTPDGFNEVEEARKVVDRVAELWRSAGVWVDVFHDNTSHSQSENLNTIVAHHNSQTRDLDVSVHFNAFDGSAHGTEVLYVTQSSLASKVSSAISSAGGFTNRGAKYRSDLAFLNNTEEPAILLETCFCDSSSDSEKYFAEFDDICQAIASSISGEVAPPEQPGQPPTQPPVETQVVDVKIYAPPGVRVDVSVNQEAEG
jgi:N-acetylmuramoyl-L-alanine amidase